MPQSPNAHGLRGSRELAARILAGVDPKDLPVWIRNQVDLRSNVAQWPLRRFNVNKYGAYGVTRSTPQNGACGPKTGEPSWIDNPTTPDEQAEAKDIKAKRWPCKHWGADLSAPEWSKVYAPKDGWILYDGPASDAPFRGYGPWVTLIAHRDAGDSMWQRGWKWATGPLMDALDFPEGLVSSSYSLIGHMAVPAGTGLVRIPLPGDFWGSISGKADRWSKLKYGGRGMMTDSDAHDDSTNYQHWEGANRPRRVFAGEQIGTVSRANHIHWEVRNAPVASGGPPTLTLAGRYDPIDYFKQNYKLMLPAGVTVATPTNGGGGILLLLALLFLSEKRGRR
jgi:murein DD-endopeptidase MepM/ murein hydrolase activator NlpD